MMTVAEYFLLLLMISNIEEDMFHLRQFVCAFFVDKYEGLRLCRSQKGHLLVKERL